MSSRREFCRLQRFLWARAILSELDSVPKTSGIFSDLLLFRRFNFVCTVPALFNFFAPRSRKLSVVQTVEKLPNYPPFPPFLHLIFGKITDFLSTPSLFFARSSHQLSLSSFGSRFLVTGSPPPFTAPSFPPICSGCRMGGGSTDG